MHGCRPRSSLLASLPSAGGCSSPILVPVPQPHTCPPGSRSPPSSTGCHPALPSPPASCKPASASQPTLTHVHPMGKLFQGSAPVPFPFPQAVGEAVPWGWQRQGAAAGLARPLAPGRRSPPVPCGANASCSPTSGSSPSPSGKATTAFSSETPRWVSSAAL